MTDLDKLRANAELVIQNLREVSEIENFGYNAESVAWVAGFIERQRLRPDLDKAALDRLSTNLGCYLGECVIACFGGEWQLVQGSWAITFDADNAAFPFSKVQKQFANGREGGDSIQGWFEVIPELFAKVWQPQQRQKKPWWKFW